MPAKQAEEKKNSTHSKKVRLPILIEFTQHISRLIAVITAMTMLLVSLAVRSSLQTVILRISISTLCIGIFLWFLNWLFARTCIEITIKKLRETFEESKKNKLVEKEV